jgi:hypothetical protein
MNQSPAYREAFPCKGMKAKSVHEKASRLASKVRSRVEELRRPVIEKVRYGLEEAMKEAEMGMKMALLTGQSSAVVSAVQLRSRLNGLLVEERRNERQPLQDLTDDQLKSYLSRLDDDAASIVGQDAAQAGRTTTH